MIAAGNLVPGDRLPPERELAAEMGVSRNVVREAIRSLVDSNVLESRQGAGVFVASLHVESLIEPLEVVLALESATLHSLAQARLVIEPGIAALATEHGSEQQIRELETLLEEEREKGPEDSARHMELDVELHGRLVRMTDNPFLVRIIESVGAGAEQPRVHQHAAPHARDGAGGPRADRRRGPRPRRRGRARRDVEARLEHVAQTLAEESLVGEESVGVTPPMRTRRLVAGRWMNPTRKLLDPQEGIGGGAA